MESSESRIKLGGLGKGEWHPFLFTGLQSERLTLRPGLAVPQLGGYLNLAGGPVIPDGTVHPDHVLEADSAIPDVLCRDFRQRLTIAISHRPACYGHGHERCSDSPRQALIHHTEHQCDGRTSHVSRGRSLSLAHQRVEGVTQAIANEVYG